MARPRACAKIAAVAGALLSDLVEFLRIPSVSAGAPRPDDLVRAAQWLRRYLEAVCDVQLVDVGEAGPLVVADAGPPDEPALLVYGHYDVQDPGPRERWSCDPFAGVVRDGRIYGRGAADDKGNMLPLLAAVRDRAAAGELALRTRIVVEGAEETGSAGACRWLRDHASGFAAAVVFDTTMADASTPLLCVGARGLVMLRARIEVAARDVHSGLYGGVARNALHDLGSAIAVLAACDPAFGEEVRPPLAIERASWARMRSGDELLRVVGAAGEGERSQRFWELTTARPALDVHEVAGGAPRTIVPARAACTLSVRLVPDQRPEAVAAAVATELRRALPADVSLATETIASAAPVLFDPEDRVLAAARRALARACGREPAVARSGGTLPVLAELARAGVPTVFSGFALDEDAVHGPDESFRVDALELGYRAARELLAELEQVLRA